MNEDPLEEIIMAELVQEASADQPAGHQSPSPVAPKKTVSAEPEPSPASWLERILSPDSLQRMMMVGGGLLVLGFVIWLWTNEVFENSLVLATTVGGANLLLLAGGVWWQKATRYKLAGRGLTLLSCMVLPLNLWLLDSQGLISIGAGGKLWIPALVISVIYAIVARITRDAMFVYTLVGGIVLTGMLFLAGTPANLFWAALPMSTFSIVTGAIAVHADRLFQEKQGAFSRDQFGVAFFRSGLIVMVAGLAVLFGGHLLTLIPEILQGEVARQALSQLQQGRGKLWVLGLLLGSGYSMVYAILNDRNSWVVKTTLAIVGCGAILQALNVCNIPLTFDLGLLTVALLTVGVNVGLLCLEKFNSGASTKLSQTADEYSAWAGNSGHVVLQAVLWFGVVRVFLSLLGSGAIFINWSHVAELAIAAVGFVTLPKVLKTGQAEIRMSEKAIWFSAGAAATFGVLVAVAGFGLATFVGSLTLGSAVVLLIAVGVYLSTRRPITKQLSFVVSAGGVSIASLWCGGLIVGVAGVAFGSMPAIVTFALLGVAACLIGAAYRRFDFVLGAGLLVMALVQAMILFNITGPYSVILAITGVGLLGLVGSKLSRRFLALPDSWTKQAVSTVSNSAVLIGAVGAVLFATLSLESGNAAMGQVGLLVVQLVSLALAAALVKEAAWRKTYFVGMAVVAATAALVGMVISTATLGQQLEIGSLALGMMAIIGGHIGWARETSENQTAVTVLLSLGCWLLAVPLVVGLITDRVNGGAVSSGEVIFAWRGVHEIGSLLVGLVLLASGILCRIRSTTIAGSSLMAVFVISNLLLFPWPEQLQSTSVLMMAGGAAFFGTAILLSVYRESVLALPGKVKAGKGIFSVLKWR